MGFEVGGIVEENAGTPRMQLRAMAMLNKSSPSLCR